MPARAKSSATAREAGEGRGLSLAVALEVLGAAAGLTAFAALIGGMMLWLRFDGLDLPADRAVELLPRSLLLTVGVHALAVPVILGAVVAAAFGLLWVVRDEKAPRGRMKAPGESWRGDLKEAGALALIVVPIAVALMQIEGLDVWPYWVVLIAAIALAVALIGRAIVGAASYARIGWTLFAAIVLVGGVLAAVRTWAAPKLEPAAVLLKEDAGGASGFLIEQTDEHVYIAPLPGSGDLLDPFADADVDRILEIPREEVARLAVRSPAGIEPDQAGREQAVSLLADLRIQQAGGKPVPVEPVATKDPVAAFAPLVHLHSDERFMPVSVSEFLENSWLMWRHAACTDYSFRPPGHIADRDEDFRERAMGRFNVAKLGSAANADPYEHVVASGCTDLRDRSATSAEHTRPHDRDGRPPGVGPGEGFYLDLWNAKLGGARDSVIDEGAQRVFAGVPAYHERHGTGGSPEQRITYWLFYANSQPPGTNGRLFSHEGDWERISVLIAPGPEPDQWLPISVRYHFHNESREVPWAAARRVAEGTDPQATHPVVYSARGSHASFPRAGNYAATLRRAGANIVTVKDEAIACPDCPVWRTWLLLEDALAQPWYGFGGAWGQTSGSSDTTGPLGPSTFKTGGQELPSGKAIEVVREQPGEDDGDEDDESEE